MRTPGAASVTIYNVAAAAGVSIKTVSRVLNREGNVRPQTRDQVLAAVSALKYRPNISARSLAGSRAYLLGLVYDNPNTAYVSELQLGVTARCREHGYHLVVEPFDSMANNGVTAVADLLTTLRLDGLILTPPVCDKVAVLDLLDREGVPYVRIAPEGELDRAARVQMDDREAALQMTTHLIDLGHRDIAFIRGHPDHGMSHTRYEGFVAAFARRGLPLKPERVRQGYFSFRSGVEATEALLNAGPAPSAIFASNDDMALGAMTVAARRGLDVPRQLSVVGFDDTPSATVVWPQLTTVRQPVGEMAAMATDLLIGRELSDQDGRPVHRTLDFQLMLRASSGPPM